MFISAPGIVLSFVAELFHPMVQMWVWLLQERYLTKNQLLHVPNPYSLNIFDGSEVEYVVRSWELFPCEMNM